MYFLFGTFAEAIERALTMMPVFIIMAKLIPPGVESSMMALNTTVVNLKSMLISPFMGVFINDYFVHVTKKNMKDYKWLCLTATIMSVGPLFFVWCMTPTFKELEERQVWMPIKDREAILA
jgi:hypothetical protein